MADGNRQLGRGYVPGPGTEQNWFVRVPDLLDGHTVNERAETMYRMFAREAKKWRDADPEAQIRVAGVGFSRGTAAEVAFLRMVHERGIRDPSTATYEIDREGIVKNATYVGPPLVPPGQVAQAAVLFDPVNKGKSMDQDRRLPPSVLSAVQIVAADERRYLFKWDRILDPGMSPDGRFLSMSVGGAHSDTGDAYLRNGLGIRSRNLGVDFLNSLSDQPFLTRGVEPDDPRVNVVHRSEQGLWPPYGLMPKVNRANPNGQNELLVAEKDKGKLADPYNAEPRDEALNARFERQRVRTGAQAMAAAGVVKTDSAELSCRLDRMAAAGSVNDWSAFLRENESLAFGVAGRAMWERARLCVPDPERLQPSAPREADREPLTARHDTWSLAH